MKTMISVIMTTYNSAAYLRKAVESVLTQTFFDFEFIIVDDGSSDETSQMIHSFKDQRIRYFRNEKNLGQTKSLNIAIQNSQTEYLVRMDADDICEPNRLEMQYRFLKENPQISVVGSWSQDIDEKGTQIRINKTPLDPLEIRAYLSGSGDLSFWCITHPTVMMRKSALADVGFYNEIDGNRQGYPQDYDLWARFMTKHYAFANIGCVLLQYRILERSDSRHFSQEQIKDRMKISVKKILYFLPDLNENDVIPLAQMLEFIPQTSPIKGRSVFSLFDQYFTLFMSGPKNSQEAKKIETISIRMKFYYLPVLFLSNPGTSLKIAVKFLCRYPYLLFDLKFYRKIAKSILTRLPSVQSKRVKKFLILR